MDWRLFLFAPGNERFSRSHARPRNMSHFRLSLSLLGEQVCNPRVLCGEERKSKCTGLWCWCLCVCDSYFRVCALIYLLKCLSAPPKRLESYMYTLLIAPKDLRLTWHKNHWISVKPFRSLSQENNYFIRMRAKVSLPIIFSSIG